MLKKLALLLPVCLMLAAVAFAAGGGAEDPLVSLSYLTGPFTKLVEAEVEERLDESDEELLELAEEGGIQEERALTWEEIRLKQEDVLLGSTGTNVLLLAGSGRVEFSSGAVVDVTTGTEVASGSNLQLNHRYMVAEDTAASFIVTSRTAVLDYLGTYRFSESDAVDYNAMAAALKQLNLFKGSFTGVARSSN